MTKIVRFTQKTRLKTRPISKALKGADPKKIRAARRKADMEWQMNLAKIKLNGLKPEHAAARDSFQSFHNTARTSLGNIRRGKSA